MNVRDSKLRHNINSTTKQAHFCGKILFQIRLRQSVYSIRQPHAQGKREATKDASPAIAAACLLVVNRCGGVILLQLCDTLALQADLFVQLGHQLQHIQNQRINISTTSARTQRRRQRGERWRGDAEETCKQSCHLADLFMARRRPRRQT